MHTLTDTIAIKRPLAEVWDFFSNPYNLSRITPPSMQFNVSSAPPREIYPGLIITYSVTPFPPFAMTWVSEITHVVPRTLFVDEQRMGPYRFWHHQHRFSQTPEGVLVEDEVNYALPFGVLGHLVHALKVEKQLREIFNFRREALRRIFQ